MRYFSGNSTGRDWVVGDIHGCFSLFEELLARIGFDAARDRVFAVGDLIDRGPESERAGEFLDQPWFTAIRGNHEQMLLDAIPETPGQMSARQLWWFNGGDWFDDCAPAARAALADRIVELPYALEIQLVTGGTAGLIHADVVAHDWPATRAWLESDAADESLLELVWSRERAYALIARFENARTGAPPVAVAGIDWVAFGHTPLAAPVACANTRWLDTGAVHGNRLSIAELALDGDVWSLPADRGTLAQGWRYC
jgi:serine/threonine protein phosphatase 1